ncbi:MAG: hypothetical protein EOO81_03215 [Oxalobacteraceae bacterium]|nr:MAG: hypothetical protein EOO81_03215 [Oxalobacteraceae bacterium]
MLNSPKKRFLTSLLAVASLFSISSAYAEPARWTFDGGIHNNSLAVSPNEATAVVSYSERPDVIVYDLTSNKVRGVLHGYVTPRNIIFAPSGKVFYVSDSSLGLVFKINNETLETISTIPVGPGAFGTAISKDGKTLYINNQAASTVTVYDLEKNQAVAVISGFAQPRQGVKLSPDGANLFVTNFLGDKISIVNNRSNKIESEIKGFDKIRAISITADGRTLFAANSGSNSIAVVDVEKKQIVKTIPVGKDPYGAALTPNESALYSGNLGDNTLSVIALPSMQVTGTISGFKQPRQAIVFTHDAKTAFVLNEDLSVSKVDLATKKIVAQIDSQ